MQIYSEHFKKVKEMEFSISFFVAVSGILIWKITIFNLESGMDL